MMRRASGCFAALLALQLLCAARCFSPQPRAAAPLLTRQSHHHLHHDHLLHDHHRQTKQQQRHANAACTGLKAQQEDYFLPLALKPYPLHLWVRRCGQLGQRVLDRWREASPTSSVVVEMRRRHNVAYNRRCHPRFPEEAKLYYGACDSVLFGISHELHKEETVPLTEESLKLWNGKGKLVLISSVSHYQQPTADVIRAVDEEAARQQATTTTTAAATTPVIQCYVHLNETSPVHEDTDIYRAEKMVLDAGGMVVRLAGLFGGKKREHDERGPSTWLFKQAVRLHPNDTISLIHYDDAATLIATVLQHGQPGNIYLGSGTSITAQAAANAILRAYKWRTKRPPNFVNPERTLFAGLDCSWTMRKLHVRANIDFEEHTSQLMW